MKSTISTSTTTPTRNPPLGNSREEKLLNVWSRAWGRVARQRCHLLPLPTLARFHTFSTLNPTLSQDLQFLEVPFQRQSPLETRESSGSLRRQNRDFLISIPSSLVAKHPTLTPDPWPSSPLASLNLKAYSGSKELPFPGLSPSSSAISFAHDMDNYPWEPRLPFLASPLSCVAMCSPGYRAPGPALPTCCHTGKLHHPDLKRSGEGEKRQKRSQAYLFPSRKNS